VFGQRCREARYRDVESGQPVGGQDHFGVERLRDENDLWRAKFEAAILEE
jgi:hypothetical protein